MSNWKIEVMVRHTVWAAIMLAGMGCGGGYDVVIENGRVLDPASGFDAIRNVGVRDGRIAAISEEPLTGDRVIDATGLVVAPGFIDLHQHGQNAESYRLKAQDGVTTALELEVGAGDVPTWYRERDGGQIINYGVSIGHIPVRMITMDDQGAFLPSGPGGNATASPEHVAEMERRIDEGLAAGALGVGFGLAYTPAATTEEFEAMLRVARTHNAVAFIHLRGGSAGLHEALGSAAGTGTPLHVVHVNSSGGARIAEFLALIDRAQASGQDVTTEAYPYNASNMQIESALFDDWESYSDEEFQIHQWVATGERLTRETFAKYRAQGGSVIIHSRTDAMTRTAITSPLTMIASDGSIVRNNQAHPRSAGTFARVLGKYVREEGVVSLMDAIRRMTIAPASRLEARVPGMARKGRVQVSADADLTVFDPETVIDRATYTEGTIPSEGIEYVLIGGVLVVDAGRFVDGVAPGSAIRAPIR